MFKKLFKGLLFKFCDFIRPLIVIPFFIRNYGVESYGYYVQIILVSTLLYPLLDMGIGMGIQRFSEKLKQKNEIKEIFGIQRLFILLFCITYIFVMLFKDVRELLLGPYQSTNMLISILLYFVFYGLNNTLQGILRAQSKIGKLVKYRIVFAIVEAVLLLLILNNNKVFNYRYILIMVFCQILYFILLTRHYRDFWNITYSSLKFSKETIIFFKYSLSIIPATLIGWITSSSDRFFITDYFGSESSGYYSAIAQYTGYMTLIVFPFTFVYFKDFSKFYDYNFSKFKHLFIKSFLICMSMSILYFIFFYLFKDFIFFNYLGLDYRPEFNKLVICFLFCFFLINIASFLSVYMLVSKQIKVMFIAICIGAIINFSLNKFFLQNYSYTNSAYYWALSVGVQILILSVFTYKSIRTK